MKFRIITIAVMIALLSVVVSACGERAVSYKPVAFDHRQYYLMQDLAGDYTGYAIRWQAETNYENTPAIQTNFISLNTTDQLFYHEERLVKKDGTLVRYRSDLTRLDTMDHSSTRVDAEKEGNKYDFILVLTGRGIPESVRTKEVNDSDYDYFSFDQKPYDETPLNQTRTYRVFHPAGLYFEERKITNVGAAKLNVHGVEMECEQYVTEETEPAGGWTNVAWFREGTDILVKSISENADKSDKSMMNLTTRDNIERIFGEIRY